MIDLVRTELLKQRTTRTFTVGIAAAPILTGVVTAVVLASAGKDGNDPLNADTLSQLVGAPASLITLIALLLGVVAMSGEYRHQTITTTFLAAPRRRDVLLAKIAAHAATGAAMGAMSVAVTAAVAIPWLRSAGVPSDVDLEVAGIAAGLVLSTGLHAALGVAIGGLVRNQTAAVIAVLVWLLAAEGILAVVMRRSDLVDWLPAAVGQALVRGDGAGEGVSPLAAAAAFGMYVLASTWAAIELTRRRDIA